MNPRRQLLVGILVAFAASALLVGVLISTRSPTQTRFSAILAGNPNQGVRLFEEKGCIRCHAVGGWGAQIGPDLGFDLPPRPSPSQLVTGMWNCAPRMWEFMRAQKLPYPALSRGEMADLFAFLYTTRYVDEPGDARRGQHLFTTKGCVRCHGVRGAGGRIGPDLTAMAGVDLPAAWAQAMWNHAPAMEGTMQELALAWPKFEGREMNDLLAYIREVSKGPRRERGLLPADPKRGWKLFQSKSCIACHSVRGQGEGSGPELGPGSELPLTLVQFAATMWNHSPEMWRAAKARNIPRPTFEGREMADLVTFLSSLRYFEPGGSPLIGESLFVERGCARCHGLQAEGPPAGPALRGRGKTYTIVTFATALWRHGPEMYQRTQQFGVSWPVLAASDVGDLLTFLNTPWAESR